MSLTTTIAPHELRANCAAWRKAGQTIGFVPTMGALHQGHLSLIEAAQKKADKVVVSIFVNPLQFGPNEDFGSYPRMLAADRKKLESVNADLLFAPIAADIYPEGFQTVLSNTAIADILCGAHRPGHFNGVLTVVCKLFNLVQPDFAFFGKKDYQQFKLITNMVRDLALPLEVNGVPTLRESDGLAMSSRNLRLTADERQQAPVIHAALSAVAEAHKKGERKTQALLEVFKNELAKEPALRLEYIDIRTQDRLDAFGERIDRPAVALTAAHLGSVRLIDNLEFGAL